MRVAVFILFLMFTASGELAKRFGRRFYYCFEVIPTKFDIMLVYVLMDGSVVEPKSRKPFWEEEMK
jgi:hypothetical protein